MRPLDQQNDPESPPRLSVIIPTCHRNDLLARCLERLAPEAQTPSALGYEVIVSDDGTRSNAQELIRENFPWARWFVGPKKGPAANRNNGAREAKSSWLLFTDDDCLPEPVWIAAYSMAIASGKSSVYEGRTYTEKNTKGPFWGAPSNENGGLLWSCNIAVRRDVFLKLGGFDELFPFPHMEDVDFRERLIANGNYFPFCPEAAVFHPLRPAAPITRQAMGHESYFYYARKHGLSLKQSGLSLRAFVKARLMWLDSSRRAGETVRFFGRSMAEAVMVAAMTPWWWMKFRSVKKKP
jgi:GT2 family glycosyltransferase